MEKPPAWPKWLGGIGLSLGILGASFYGYQTATAEKAVALDLSERAPMATRANAGEVLSWVGKMAMVNGALCVVSILLCIGSVLLLLRRRGSGPTLKTWAFLKIAISAWFLYFNAGYDNALLNLVFAGPNAMAGDGAEVASSSARVETIVVLGVRALWLMALPAFVLFWFSKRTVSLRVRDWR
jgi:hypothetical protein